MSDTYGTASPSSSDLQPGDAPGKVDTAKQEAADLKDTAASQAKDVLATAKDEASSVVGEAKTQAKDLYAQTQRELKDQADAQQQRIAGGLRSVGDELASMAANAGGGGVASDLVQQVSTRLSAAGAWLGDRDPSAVLAEVKRFARRKPGTFILGAAVAGIVVGRLTRALAANASDDKKAADDTATGPVTTTPATDASPVPMGDTPVYAQNFSTPTAPFGEGSNERPDSL